MKERGRMPERVVVVRRRSIPGDDGLAMSGKRIIAVLENQLTGDKRTVIAENVITSRGDIHYAERATTKTPADTFNLLHLSTESSTRPPAKGTTYGANASYIAGSSALVATGYPVAGDTDADNSGSSGATVSWLFSYAKGDFASGVIRGVIATTAPGSSSPILTDFIFGSTFTKTTDDTLKVFVNHAFLGTT